MGEERRLLEIIENKKQTGLDVLRRECLLKAVLKRIVEEQSKQRRRRREIHNDFHNKEKYYNRWTKLSANNLV